jgi:hypothetical protein
MAQGDPPFRNLTDDLLDRVIESLDLWDVAAARLACRALRVAAGRAARRLFAFAPATLLCERGGDGFQQARAAALLRRAAGWGQHAALLVSTSKKCVHLHPTLRAAPPFALQKRWPTSFQLFPNAREVVLDPSQRLRLAGGGVVEEAYAPEVPLRYADVLDVVFRLPSAPAEAAAARAALAGVTRLEVQGGALDPRQLPAALLHLPGLRAVSLKCGNVVQDEQEAKYLGMYLACTLCTCQSLESLEWRVAWRQPTGETV